MKNNRFKAAMVCGGLAGIAVVAAISGAYASPQDASSSASQSVEAKAPRCLDGGDTHRIHVVDDHTLLVYDGRGFGYKLDIGGPCRSMTDFSVFGFEFFGSNQICKAHDAKLIYSDGMTRGSVRCLINGVTPVSKAELKVLDPD